jgi:hypothetical protein
MGIKLSSELIFIEFETHDASRQLYPKQKKN